MSMVISEKQENKFKEWVIKSTIPLSALLLALIVSGIAILLMGKNPLLAFFTIIEGAFGSGYSLTEVLVKTSPLLLAAIGTAFAFRCQMWNIGVEGQLLIGGLAASCVALFLDNFPGWITMAMAIIAAFIAGGIWAGIAGYLKAKYGASEIINTIMMNYLAVYLVNYLVRGPLKDAAGYVPQSKMFAQKIWFPILVENTRLHLGIIVAFIAAVVGYILLWRTSLGYNIIAVGANPKAAEANGIPVRSHMVLAMIISGGLAGLAGAGEVLGLYHRMLDGISAGYGFSAMAAAILGGLNPAGVSIFSLFFAILRVGADHMQRTMGVPIALVYLIEGTVILFVQGRKALPQFITKIYRSIIKKNDAYKAA